MPNKKRKNTNKDKQINKKLKNLEEYCRCNIHNEIVSENYDIKYVILNVKTRKDFSPKALNYLIDAGQLDPTRFTVMGRGQYAPVAANDNDSKRALNRRVEIIITREKNENEPQNEIADSDSAVETIQLADSSNGEIQ